MCVSRRSEGQCESKATSKKKDKMQEIEDREEGRDGNWDSASSGAVGGWWGVGGGGWRVKRVAAGGNRGVCLCGAETLRAFCLFVFDRTLLHSLLAFKPENEPAQVNAELLHHRLLLHN